MTGKPVLRPILPQFNNLQVRDPNLEIVAPRLGARPDVEVVEASSG
jgi:hypothetical protein